MYKLASYVSESKIRGSIFQHNKTKHRLDNDRLCGVTISNEEWGTGHYQLKHPLYGPLWLDTGDVLGLSRATIIGGRILNDLIPVTKNNSIKLVVDAPGVGELGRIMELSKTRIDDLEYGDEIRVTGANGDSFVGYFVGMRKILVLATGVDYHHSGWKTQPKVINKRAKYPLVVAYMGNTPSMMYFTFDEDNVITVLSKNNDIDSRVDKLPNYNKPVYLNMWSSFEAHNRRSKLSREVLVAIDTDSKIDTSHKYIDIPVNDNEIINNNGEYTVSYTTLCKNSNDVDIDDLLIIANVLRPVTRNDRQSNGEGTSIYFDKKQINARIIRGINMRTGIDSIRLLQFRVNIDGKLHTFY